MVSFCLSSITKGERGVKGVFRRVPKLRHPVVTRTGVETRPTVLFPVFRCILGTPSDLDWESITSSSRSNSLSGFNEFITSPSPFDDDMD